MSSIPGRGTKIPKLSCAAKKKKKKKTKKKTKTLNPKTSDAEKIGQPYAKNININPYLTPYKN